MWFDWSLLVNFLTSQLWCWVTNHTEVLSSISKMIRYYYYLSGQSNFVLKLFALSVIRSYIFLCLMNICGWEIHYYYYFGYLHSHGTERLLITYQTDPEYLNDEIQIQDWLLLYFFLNMQDLPGETLQSRHRNYL